MIRNDMRRPTNEHEIFRGRMKQGNSRTDMQGQYAQTFTSQ